MKGECDSKIISSPNIKEMTENAKAQEEIVNSGYLFRACSFLMKAGSSV